MKTMKTPTPREKTYTFKEGVCHDPVYGADYKLGGEFTFVHGVPYVFTSIPSELGLLRRTGYKRAGLLDVIKSWFIRP